jgi:hypothetical protein
LFFSNADKQYKKQQYFNYFLNRFDYSEEKLTTFYPLSESLKYLQKPLAVTADPAPAPGNNRSITIRFCVYFEERIRTLQPPKAVFEGTAILLLKFLCHVANPDNSPVTST